MFHHTETSQQRADRLLAEHHARRYVQPGHFVIVEGQPSRWDRLCRALRPWCVGFHNSTVDAIGIAFLFFFTALLTAFAAMCWAEHAAPPASTAAPLVEATPSPVADSPLGGGAKGKAR